MELTEGAVVAHRRYEVAREKVRDYVRAVTGRDIPDSGPVVAPPTFAACFALAGDVLESLLAGHGTVLHTSQQIDVHRPLRVGDVLDCTTTVQRYAAREEMTLLTLVTEATAAGEAVVTATAALALLPPGETA